MTLVVVVMKMKELSSQGDPGASSEVARRGSQGMQDKKRRSTTQVGAQKLYKVPKKGGNNCQTFGRIHLPRQPLSTERVVDYQVVNQMNNER